MNVKQKNGLKRRYYVPFKIAKCFDCDTRYRVERGHNRGPRGIVAVNVEIKESLPPYCNSCYPIYNTREWQMVGSVRSVIMVLSKL